MKIKLIAYDLDGTLLADDKTIPAENLKALQYAADKGVITVPASGRHINGLPEEIKALPFTRYCILINGAKVYDIAGDEVLYRAELSNETALALFDYARTQGCLYDCYINDGGYMTKSMYDLLDEFIDDKHFLKYALTIRTPVPDLPELVREFGGNVQKVQFFFRSGDDERRREQIELLPQLFEGIITSSSIPGNIEINSSKAGKGPALEALCKCLGISPEETLVFGDGTNDLSMFGPAGIAAAPANAVEEVLAAADIVTDSNNNAGIAKTIYELI